MKLHAQTDFQKEWMTKLTELTSKFSERAYSYDELGALPKENIHELIQIGYTGLAVSKKFGGKGLSVSDLVLFQETIALGDGPTALAIGWHMSTIGEIFDFEKWKVNELEFLARETTKGALFNRAASESGTGSPTRGGRPATVASRKGDVWLINGRKSFTTMAQALDYFIVSAWIEEEQTIGSFLVQKNVKGVSIEETWDTISMRGTGSHDLVLSNVLVDQNKLVELTVARPRQTINGWLLHIPACYLGIARSAANYAMKFAKEYAPNSLSGPICDLPNVRNLIGEIELELMKAEHFLYSVARLYDDVDSQALFGNELGAVKYAVVNSALLIVDKSMRIVGAKSLQRSNPLQRYYRDVRSGLHNPPMDDATLERLASTALARLDNV